MSDASPAVYLASRSPRRRALLEQMAVPFEVLEVHVPEEREPSESPAEYVLRVAGAKALAGRDALGAGDRRPVLGADTEVVVDDRVLGKPVDAAQAEAMLALLSGREHRVLTAVALATAGGLDTELSESRVRLRSTTPAERRAYCATGEPLGKAGAYAVQGLAALFIERIEGSYSGVMGLPVFETGRLLDGIGLGPLSFKG